jgi:hypothetical protein
MSDNIELSYLMVCTTYPEAEREEMLDLIQGIQNLSQPGYLPQRDVYIGPENLDDYTVVYSNGKPEPPDVPVDRTVILSEILEDDVFHIHSYIEPEHQEEIIKLHGQMWGGWEQIKISSIASVYEVNSNLSEMFPNLEMAAKDDADVGSIGFSDNEFGYSIRENPDSLQISVFGYSEESISSGDLKAVVEDHLQKAKTELEAFIP